MALSGRGIRLQEMNAAIVVPPRDFRSESHGRDALEVGVSIHGIWPGRFDV
jgi:hypothetical protein